MESYKRDSLFSAVGCTWLPELGLSPLLLLLPALTPSRLFLCWLKIAGPLSNSADVPYVTARDLLLKEDPESIMNIVRRNENLV
jgi:hypothetical protein